MTGSESLYSKLGVSSQKEDVHSALEKTRIEELFPGSFCKILPDISGDPEYAVIQHQDGAGSKVIQAYIHYKETEDPNWFRGIIYDTISMNLDDILCVGVTDPILFTDSIDRNADRVPGEVISVLIDEFNNACKRLRELGVEIYFAGGETADLGDQVKTLTVNGAATVRFKRSDVITGQNIEPGNIIVGLESGGRSVYEEKENSGMGSNGLTLARHALMCDVYREKYPETIDENKIEKKLAYFGPYKFDDSVDGLDMTVGEAILSPTKTYAPVLSEILKNCRKRINGIVHNTGGGQTKCLHLGKGIHYIKDNLFEMNQIFRLIQEHSNETWKNMYPTFNSGNRLDIICEPDTLDEILRISKKFNVEAKQTGRCEKSDGENRLTIKSKYGEFEYGKET